MKYEYRTGFFGVVGRPLLDGRQWEVAQPNNFFADFALQPLDRAPSSKKSHKNAKH